MNKPLTKRQAETRDNILSTIAREELEMETLEKRWSDQLDFYDLSVWEIKRALERAFEEGQNSVK